MSKYIFTEEEWMKFNEEIHGHTLLAIDGSTYKSIKMGGMDKRLPGSETYDRLLGVNVFNLVESMNRMRMKLPCFIT